MQLFDQIHYLTHTHMSSKVLKVSKTKKESKVLKESKVMKEPKIMKEPILAKPGIRDLNKIINDPETYAKEIDVKRLVTILQKLSDYYYASDESLIDDETYDIMLDVLKDRDPENAYLFQTGIEKPSKDDTQLPFSMPSLNKIKPGEKSLTKWFNDYMGPYIVMDKLDGISMQFNKDDKGNFDLYTKKQTNVGTSKKYLLKHLIPDKILDKIPNNTCIRGELVIAKK